MPFGIDSDQVIGTYEYIDQSKTPRTRQDELLERWRDVQLLAEDIVDESYNDEYLCYFLMDGTQAYDRDVAIKRTIEYLLSPAKEGK